MGVRKMDGLQWKMPINMDDLGVPLFFETTKQGISLGYHRGWGAQDSVQLRQKWVNMGKLWIKEMISKCRYNVDVHQVQIYPLSRG